MGRFVGIHTMPGFSPEVLDRATERLGRLRDARFVRAYSSFGASKVICDWEVPDKDAVARTYAQLGFPCDEIGAVEAISRTRRARGQHPLLEWRNVTEPCPPPPPTLTRVREENQ
jgi:Nickel responsive protein SCO4226-like